MKLFKKTIILLLVSVSIVTSGTLKDDEAFMKDVVQTCMIQSSASDSDVMEFMSRETPTTLPGKCLRHCVYNRLEIMSEEKFVPSKLIGEISERQNSDGRTLMEIIYDVANECGDETDEDVCESTAKILNCLNAAVKKRDFCPNLI